MKIKIICVGKLKEKYLKDGVEEYLKRISMGPLKLPEELNIGEYRRLSEEEINMLKGN